MDALPLAVVDALCRTADSTQEARMDSYYHSHDLGKFSDMGKGNKELWDKFMGYYSAVFAEGALTEREKALIALAVAHTVQCPYCIDAYTQASLEKGSNVEEMTEAVHVACAIRGGASLVHGVQMRNVAEKLSM
jgi:4-carboxymuconolactone decarboxylase